MQAVQQIWDYLQSKPTKWFATVLCLIGMLVYVNTLTNEYALDDIGVITQNRYVQQGMAGIGDIISHPMLYGFTGRPVYDSSAINDLYRPLPLVTYAIEQQLTPNEPMTGHLVNILLFGGSVLVLFGLMRRLTARMSIAVIGTLLFALHPIHTEVVANIKGRDELLAFVTGIGALNCLLDYASGKHRWGIVAAMVLYFLALWSKETPIFLVAFAPIAVWYIRKPTMRKMAGVVLSTATVAVAYLYIRASVLNAYNANHAEIIDFIENPLTGVPAGKSAMATAMVVLLNYLRLLVLPYPLLSDYTFATLPFYGMGDWLPWMSVVVYLALIAIVIIALNKKRDSEPGSGILLLLLSLAPVSNLFFLTGSIMAERFLFYPSAGFCLLLGWLIVQIRQRAIRAGLLTIVCIGWAGITIARNADWKNNKTLFAADVKTAPNNVRLLHGLGYELAAPLLSGTTTDRTDAEEAMRMYRKSMALYADQDKLHADMAQLMAALGERDSAIVHYHAALKLKPGTPTYLSALGGIYFGMGQYDSTIALCRTALQKAPMDGALLANLSLCYLQKGMPDSAIIIAERSLATGAEQTLAKDVLAAAKRAQQAASDTAVH